MRVCFNVKTRNLGASLSVEAPDIPGSDLEAGWLCL